MRSRSMRAIFWKRLSPESSRGSGGRTRTTTLKLFPAATTPGAISSEGWKDAQRLAEVGAMPQTSVRRPLVVVVRAVEAVGKSSLGAACRRGQGGLK